jgi:DNA-binding transcriptional regulator LsrR (DeoR family)
MRVVQILGGLGQPEADTYGADLAHRLAQALGARPRVLAAPGIVANKLVRDTLLADAQIADTLNLGAKANVLLVGLGVPSTPGSVVQQAGILAPHELEQLTALGAVGDIALRFFDQNGQPIQHELCDRMIGLDLEQIKKIPRVIGVAGCQEKFEVIRAALRGKLINVLVTDDQMASRLLAEVSYPAQLASPGLPVGAGLVLD